MDRKFGNILKNLREEINLSQQELADKLNVTRQTISNYETNKRLPNKEMFEIIADFFNVDMDYLYGMSDIKNKYQSLMNSSDIDLSKIPGIILPVKMRKIPILGTIACGEPIFAEENYEGYFMLDTNLPNSDFVLKAKGDSMIEANIFDGDLVFFKKKDDVDNGSIAAVLVDDEATLKKVNKSNEIIVLQPCNSHYDPIIISKKDHKSVRILGQMIGVYSNRSR